MCEGVQSMKRLAIYFFFIFGQMYSTVLFLLRQSDRPSFTPRATNGNSVVL
jgi:hypothetical protein